MIKHTQPITQYPLHEHQSMIYLYRWYKVNIFYKRKANITCLDLRWWFWSKNCKSLILNWWFDLNHGFWALLGHRFDRLLVSSLIMNKIILILLEYIDYTFTCNWSFKIYLGFPTKRKPLDELSNLRHYRNVQRSLVLFLFRNSLVVELLPMNIACTFLVVINLFPCFLVPYRI